MNSRIRPKQSRIILELLWLAVCLYGMELCASYAYGGQAMVVPLQDLVSCFKSTAIHPGCMITSKPMVDLYGNSVVIPSDDLETTSIVMFMNACLECSYRQIETWVDFCQERKLRLYIVSPLKPSAKKQFNELSKRGVIIIPETHQLLKQFGIYKRPYICVVSGTSKLLFKRQLCLNSESMQGEVMQVLAKDSKTKK